ncbi:MAG: DnaA/Hda family protein [Geminicoccaceae bacterium]
MTAAAPRAPDRLPPRAVQLALDLPHADGDRLTDFMPAAPNHAALDAVLRWPDWPARVCLLIGPAACGKTHLARVWAERAEAGYLRGSELWAPAEPLARLAAAACVVDDADEVPHEDQLFHLWNRVVGAGGSLLLTASRPVPAWGVRLPDLRSRLLTAWPVRIDPPDDGLLQALLVKQLADRQIRADREVVEYLVRRMERSFTAARLLVRELDRASLRARRPVTMPLARAVLDELAARQEGEE